MSQYTRTVRNALNLMTLSQASRGKASMCSGMHAAWSSSAWAWAVHMSRYTRPALSSSSCVPASTTLPACMTKILSHFCTVDSLCATKTLVRPCASSCTAQAHRHCSAHSGAPCSWPPHMVHNEKTAAASMRMPRAINHAPPWLKMHIDRMAVSPVKPFSQSLLCPET